MCYKLQISDTGNEIFDMVLISTSRGGLASSQLGIWTYAQWACQVLTGFWPDERDMFLLGSYM